MRRMPAFAAIAVVLLLAGCGRMPETTAFETPAPPLPDACLGPGLDLALGYGAYAVPLDGQTADADVLATWQSATLQLPPASGQLTLCTYVADHPTPFSTDGGDDTIVCVLVDAAGSATLLADRPADTAAACVPEAD